MNYDEFVDVSKRLPRFYSEGESVVWLSNALSGEAGEICNETKKVTRDDGGYITVDRREKIIEELGDVLWYATCLAQRIGSSLDEVKARNINKLTTRYGLTEVNRDAVERRP